MSLILRKGQILQQPTYPAPLDKGDSLNTGLAFALNSSVGPFDSVSGTWASTWNRAKVPVPQGLALYGGGVAQVAEWSRGPIVGSNGNGSGGVTFAVVANPFAEARESCLIGVMMNGSPYKQIALYANMDGNVGSASSGTLSIEAYNGANQGYGNASGAIDGKFHLFVGIFRSGIDATLYVDGVDATSSFGAGVGGTGLGDFGTDASSRISVGSESYNTSTRFASASFPFASAWNRAITRDEVLRLNERVWRLWRAPTRRIFAVSGGSSSITLVVANSTEANTGGTGAITQVNLLTAANSVQGNTGSSPAITQTHILIGANSTQANASSTGSIAGGANLTIAPSDQANPSSTGAITQTHALVMAASVQDNIAAASPIVQAHILAGSNSTQGNLGGTGAISLSSGNLIGAPSNQTNLGGTGVISMVGIVPDAFLSSMAVSTAIKKPGVPTGTPDWLKTILETVLGRRGNKIAVPAEQNLTFSSPPTQAECQALYQYVNSVRSAVADLINRLDS